jgi:hypothetical protein
MMGKMSSEKRQGISRLRGTVGYSKGISGDLYHCNDLGASATTVPSYDITVGAKMYIIVLFDKTTICLSLSITMGQKTYNSGYSLVVTHLTTNPPVRCLNRAERTGSLVFNVLWSYVEDLANSFVYSPNEKGSDCL